MKESLLKKTVVSLAVLIISSSILNCSLLRAQVEPGMVPLKKMKYTSQGLRDPFQSPFEVFEVGKEPTPAPEPIAAIKANLPHLQVQGIVWGSELSQAIINNTVVKVGEVIADAKILDIRKEGVYVLYEGGRYILRPISPVESSK